VRVVAVVQAEQTADVERDPARERGGGEKLRGPVVVTDAVDDREFLRLPASRAFAGVGS